MIKINGMRESEHGALTIIGELEIAIRRLETISRVDTDDNPPTETLEAARNCIALLRYYVMSVSEGKRRLMEAFESFETLGPGVARTNVSEAPPT